MSSIDLVLFNVGCEYHSSSTRPTFFHVGYEDHMDSSLPHVMDTDLNNSKLVLDILKLHPHKRLGQYIDYFIFHPSVLELHYSFLHIISDIVILDIDVL